MRRLLHGLVDLRPVIGMQAARDSEFPIYQQGGRIYPEHRLISPGAEPHLVIKTLLEHAQGRDLGTLLRPFRQLPGRHHPGEALFSGDATGGDRRHRTHFQWFGEITHAAGNRVYGTLGSAVQTADQAAAGADEVFDVAGLFGTVYPADLIPDTFHCPEIFSRIVTADIHQVSGPRCISEHQARQ